MHAPWPGLCVRLQGEFVTLDPLRPDHEQALFDASRDPEIWRWIARLHPLDPPYLDDFVPTRESFAARFARRMAESEDGRAASFAVIWHSTGTLVGSATYCGLRFDDRRVEVGTWLIASARGTVVNTETKFLMLEHAFERIGCERVEFHIDASNAPARAAIEAMQVTFEGILRRYRIRPTGVRDVACYSMISEEWPDARRHLEQRRAMKAVRSPDLDFSDGGFT